MFASFIIALREGVEAALVIAIALSYLRKVGREDLHRVVYRALGAAILASVAGAYLFRKLEWSEEAFEGWTLLASAAFVFTMVVWMWRHSKGLKAAMERRLGEISSRSSGAAAGVFLFVFLMVFREGVETVLLLSAVSLTSDSLSEAAGLVLGLALAVVFGVTFIRGTVRIDLRRFFRITTVILFVVVLQLLITGLHELSEGGILPSSAREMAWIGPIVKNEVFFFVTVLALAAWMVLFDWRRREEAAAPAGGAARRKAVWSARRERLWMMAVCSASFLFIVFVTAEFVYARAESQLTPAIPLAAVDGKVRIPVRSVSDGLLHRFSYTSAQGVAMRLIVIQKPDQSLVAALDACMICGNQGYYQRGSNVLCRNCASAIFIPSIGASGGCNPIAVRSHVEGSDLVIEAADLEPGARRFVKPSAGG